MKPLDPRLLRYSAAARGYLTVTVALGLAATGLILVQAGLLAHVLASAATGTGVAVLAGSLGVLLAVLLARAAASYGGEIAALRAAAAVKSQLRRRLTDHALQPGPVLAGPVHRPGTGPARSPRWPPGAWTGWTPTSPATCPSSCWPAWSRSRC